MNKERLLHLYELSQSKEWKEIRKELLNISAEKSGNDIYCDKYLRGSLYVIREVDNWITNYLTALDEEKKRKGDS